MSNHTFLAHDEFPPCFPIKFNFLIYILACQGHFVFWFLCYIFHLSESRYWVSVLSISLFKANLYPSGLPCLCMNIHVVWINWMIYNRQPQGSEWKSALAHSLTRVERHCAQHYKLSILLLLHSLTRCHPCLPVPGPETVLASPRSLLLASNCLSSLLTS